MTFDTLSYAKKLKAAGFTEAQAEVLAEAQAGLIHEQLATKDDLKALEERMSFRMNELEQRLSHRIEAMESKLTIRLGSLIAIAVGVVAALVKLL